MKCSFHSTTVLNLFSWSSRSSHRYQTLKAMEITTYLYLKDNQQLMIGLDNLHVVLPATHAPQQKNPHHSKLKITIIYRVGTRRISFHQYPRLVLWKSAICYRIFAFFFSVFFSSQAFLDISLPVSFSGHYSNFMLLHIFHFSQKPLAFLKVG